MLPAPHRLTRPAEFSATVRRGRRAGRSRVVVHVLLDGGVGDAPAGSAHGRPTRPPSPVPPSPVPQRPEPVRPGPGAVVRGASARVGLVVSKSVGSSVVRHRVSRRLRHVMAPLVDELPDGAAVVLRALPGAATASSAELAADVVSALRRLGVLAPPR